MNTINNNSEDNSFKEIEHLSIHSWILNHGIRTETGALLDFKDHAYLYDIYKDESPYLCCMKAGQIGFSTMAIIKTIWLSKNRGINIGYILPTVEMVQKFVGSKVNGMAQQNQIIANWMRDKDSIVLKQIGKNFIHYLGAQTERSAIMLSLDMLVGDEYDKAPQNILEVYNSRLQHSDYGYKWIFSNPTRPDFGVDRFWQMSDQKKWHITHSCGERYIMDENCINYGLKMYQCPHCKEVITKKEIQDGEWIATTEGEWSGYWIPLWINSRITADKIADYKKSSTKEYFANFVAGLPYVGLNNALSQDKLTQCLNPLTNAQEPRVIIGLDTGHNLHYTMMNKQGVFYHGYCPSIDENPTPNYDPYDEIDSRLRQYPNSILVADQGGDLIGIRKLQAKYRGRVFLCWFTKETKNQQMIRWAEGDEYGKVLVDRNRTIQLIVDEIIDQRITFNGSKEDWQPFFDHALNIYRVKEYIGDEDDPQYGWRWVWKRKGPDHFFLSFVYACIGMDKFAEAKATIIGTDVLGELPMGRFFDSSQNLI